MAWIQRPLISLLLLTLCLVWRTHARSLRVLTETSAEHGATSGTSVSGRHVSAVARPLPAKRVVGPASLPTLGSDPDDVELPSPARTPGGGELVSWPGLVGSQAGQLAYWNGSLMADPITVYFILYGSWPKEYGAGVLQGFVNSLSNDTVDSQGPTLHGWWRLVTQYAQQDGKGVSSQVRWGSAISVSSINKSLGDGFGSSTTNDIAKIVSDQILRGSLPLDGKAIYFVLTSADIKVGDKLNGFCGLAGYCGWHAAVEVNGTAVQYALVGDPTEQCNMGCGLNEQFSATPNGFYNVDSMMSTIAHELSEAATDPDAGKGWLALGSDGQTLWETADLCMGQFTDKDHPQLRQNKAMTYAYNLLGVDGYKFLVQAFPVKGQDVCAIN